MSKLVESHGLNVESLITYNLNHVIVSLDR